MSAELVIDGWASWGRIFQSQEVFAPMIREICLRHNLPEGTIGSCTPGTNAVFRVGADIFKIFAPAESGIEPNDAELWGMIHAGKTGVPVAKIRASGVLEHKYSFPYIVMEYVDGEEGGDALPHLPPDQRIQFAQLLRDHVANMNIPVNAPEYMHVYAGNARTNGRWEPFPKLKDAVEDAVRRADRAEQVFVHGDLTAENVLVGPDGRPRILDFGDCQIAPAYYEWMPLVFDLFRCDPVLLDAWFGPDRGPDFCETLTTAVLVHDFGGGFVRDLCMKFGLDPAELAGREALRDLIVCAIESGR